MTILRFTTGLIFYWVALIFLSKIAISSFIPKSKGFEKIIGDENKIKNVPLKDISRASSSQSEESQEYVFGHGSYAMYYNAMPQARKHALRDDVSISEARSSFRIAGDLKDSKPKKSEGEYIEWLSKHQYSSGEIQTSREKEVYRDLQSLLERLKEFRFKNASQLNCNDKAVLLLHEKIQKSILKDFEKLFKRISKNIYPDNFAENSQVMPLAFDIIDWLALNELNKGIIMKNLLKNKDVIKGLDLYISTKIIHNRGYIEIFKADDIQQYLLKHQDLEHIINLLNCLEKNHWKKVELGFIRAHLIRSFNVKIKDPALASSTFKGFQKTLKSIEKASSFNPEWLKVLSMDSAAKSAPFFFVEKVFVLHILNCCQKYFENFKMSNLTEQKVEFFTKSFNVFKEQLNYHDELENSEYVHAVAFTKHHSVIEHVLSLKKFELKEKPFINKVSLDDICIVFSKELKSLDRNWISKNVEQCKKLDRDDMALQFMSKISQAPPRDMEFTSWLNNRQLKDFYNELLELNRSYMTLSGFLKSI